MVHVLHDHEASALSAAPFQERAVDLHQAAASVEAADGFGEGGLAGAAWTDKRGDACPRQLERRHVEGAREYAVFPVFRCQVLKADRGRFGLRQLARRLIGGRVAGAAQNGARAPRALGEPERVGDAARPQTEPHALGVVETCELLAAPPMRDASFVKVDYLVGKAVEVVYAVFGDKHRRPLLLPARDRRAKPGDRFEVEVGRRFVQHDEPGRCRRGARARHALLLPARENEEACVEQRLEVERA